MQRNYRDYQYSLAQQRDRNAGLSKRCVLCATGVPRGTDQADDYHEIIPKSALPGPRLQAQLYALPNIAPACRYHHQMLGRNRLIWMKAMVAAGLATEQDYQHSPYWSPGPYPPLRDCYGRYGYGTHYFHTVPESLVLVYVGHAARIHDFCRDCCPITHTCKGASLP